MRTVSLLVVCLLASACAGGNPSAPSAPVPTTALLTIKLDAQCAAVRTMSADIYIDGAYVGSVPSGSSYGKTVDIGSHNVEAAAYTTSGQLGRHWGPATVSVPSGGYTELFYCN